MNVRITKSLEPTAASPSVVGSPSTCAGRWFLIGGCGSAFRWTTSETYSVTQHMKRLLLLSILTCLPCSVALAAEAQGKVLSYGLFRFSGKEEVVKSPETTSGVTRVPAGTPILVASTNRIPARIGVRFGMSYELVNVAAPDGEIKVTKIARHPRITKPGGKVSEGFTFLEPQWIKGGRVVGWTGYGFDHEYELAAGDWEFEMQLEGKTLLKQKFTVFKP